MYLISPTFSSIFPCLFIPNNLFNKWTLTTIFWYISGNFPGWPKILPTNLSPLVKNGSIFRPTPIKPPGIQYIKSFSSAFNDTILLTIGIIFFFPFWLFISIIPGFISTTSPTFNIPLINVPPATPPFKFLLSVPGLFISKLRTTINLGGDTKSLFGIGNLHKYWITTSILYFNWAEIRIIGLVEALIPSTNFLIYWYYCIA